MLKNVEVSKKLKMLKNVETEVEKMSGLVQLLPGPVGCQPTGPGQLD